MKLDIMDYVKYACIYMYSFNNDYATYNMMNSRDRNIGVTIGTFTQVSKKLSYGSRH
jgi:hypothetical protein